MARVRGLCAPLGPPLPSGLLEFLTLQVPCSRAPRTKGAGKFSPQPSQAPHLRRRSAQQDHPHSRAPAAPQPQEPALVLPTLFLGRSGPQVPVSSP